jgi:hypothetical protein
MPTRDPLRGRTGWVLERCHKSHTCPKIIQTNTSADYWNHRESAGTTDPMSRHDLGIPGYIRMYLSASVPHAAGSGTIAMCKYPLNPNTSTYELRALTVALWKWVVEGIAPPPSQIPTLRARTLVPPEQLNWPAIPGVLYTGLVASYPLLDFGPDFRHEDESGIITENPPHVTGREYTLYVPQVDADGNDVAGIRSNALLAPIGTYTGFNYRAAGFSEGEICDNRGMFIPFPKTRAEAQAAGDPRKSLQERYGDHAGYVAAVTAAANALVAKGYLLPEDALRLINQAEASTVLK